MPLGSLLGAEANQAISGLISKAAGAGVNLRQGAQEIALGIKLGGKGDQSVGSSADVGGAAGSGATADQGGGGGGGPRRSRPRWIRRSSTAIAEAEKQAAYIRAEAKSMSEKVKKEGYLQADSIAAKGGTGLAAVASNAAARQLREGTDSKSAHIAREANARADSLIAQAKR